MFGRSNAIPSLDGLRALSIMLVLLSHAQGTHGFPTALVPTMGLFGNFGNLGVRIFFAISGFLITMLLLSESDRTGAAFLKDFYLRRFFRIFPAFYAYAGVVIILSLSHTISLDQGDIAHALTYTMNFHQARAWWLGHTWSLSVEEQFYILWPAVVAFGGRRSALRVSAATVLLSPLLKCVTYYFFPALRESIGESFQTIADPLAIGCLLATIREWLGNQPLYIRLIRSRVMLCVPLLILLANRFRNHHPHFSWFCAEPILHVCIALGIDWCIRNAQMRPVSVLNTPPLIALGVLSYSLYLWQQPFLNPYFRSILTTFPLNVALALSAALCSYLFVERPCLQLRKRVLRRVSRSEEKFHAAMEAVAAPSQIS
jgi:peptidoglycan/LPS O-acetylase OafA/YrhL